MIKEEKQGKKEIYRAMSVITTPVSRTIDGVTTGMKMLTMSRRFDDQENEKDGQGTASTTSAATNA